MELYPALHIAFNRCLAKAKLLWPDLDMYNIKLRIEDIGDDYVGLADQNINVVYINPAYARMNRDYVIQEIIPHEIAHIVQGIMFPYARYIHGKEWKEATRALGGVPTAMARFPAIDI